MSNLLYDFIPVALFFFTFKFYGIYAATTVGIIATAIQVVITKLWKKKFDKQQLVTLGVFVVFGGMTLYFHDPLFVKWKPTIIFWLFGLVLLLSQLFMKKPLLQRMMENMLAEKNHQMPGSVWKKMNFAWAIFFILLGTVNLYIVYHYSTEVWVNFKFYGIFGLLLGFSVLQAVWLSRYISQ